MNSYIKVTGRAFFSCFFVLPGFFIIYCYILEKIDPQILLVTVSPEIWKNYMICYFIKLKRELFCNLVSECSDFWVRVGLYGVRNIKKRCG